MAMTMSPSRPGMVRVALSATDIRTRDQLAEIKGHLDAMHAAREDSSCSTSMTRVPPCPVVAATGNEALTTLIHSISGYTLRARV